jgi:hypothetical protein
VARRVRGERRDIAAACTQEKHGESAHEARHFALDHAVNEATVVIRVGTHSYAHGVNARCVFSTSLRRCLNLAFTMRVPPFRRPTLPFRCHGTIDYIVPVGTARA